MATTVKLSRPLKVDDKDIAEVVLDFDKLSGADVEACEIEASERSGRPVAIKMIDTGFHAQLAARASGIPVERLRALSARDYIRVTTAVQGFLADAD